MGRVFHPTYLDRHRVKRTCKNWYAEWTGADGSTHRKKVGPIKSEATEFLAMQESAANRQRLGLSPAPSNEARAGKLESLRAEYLAVLAARDTDPEYRIEVDRHLTKILAWCEWQSFADIRGDDLTRFLGNLRDSKRGPGPATLNNYLRSAKGFAKWLAERLDTASPLRKLKPYPEEVDRRRSRRLLTDAELDALIRAAERCPPRGSSAFTGWERAMLYRLAAFTGLRASELASLTPNHFRLDAIPPDVAAHARDSKGKREEAIPLPAHLVPLLREWFARRTNPRARLWPGRWAEVKQQIQWLKRDLKRAGIPLRDDRGRRVTFHSLKRRYVVGLIHAGARVHEVRRLARHKDVRTTLAYYTDENMTDLGKLADKLPPPG